MEINEFFTKPVYSSILIQLYRGAMSKTDVCKAVNMTYSYVFHKIRDLETAKLVNCSKIDGRKHKVTLTDQGKMIAVNLDQVRITLKGDEPINTAKSNKAKGKRKKNGTKKSSRRIQKSGNA